MEYHQSEVTFHGWCIELWFIKYYILWNIINHMSHFIDDSLSFRVFFFSDQ